MRIFFIGLCIIPYFKNCDGGVVAEDFVIGCLDCGGGSADLLQVLRRTMRFRLQGLGGAVSAVGRDEMVGERGVEIAKMIYCFLTRVVFAAISAFVNS